MREESAERLMLPPRTPATGPRRQRSAGAWLLPARAGVRGAARPTRQHPTSYQSGRLKGGASSRFHYTVFGGTDRR